MYEKDLEKNIAYLQKTVPPDDIYLFAELTYQSSIYLLSVLDDIVDIHKLMEKNKSLDRIARNITNYYVSRQENRDITINLRLYDSD